MDNVQHDAASVPLVMSIVLCVLAALACVATAASGDISIDITVPEYKVKGEDAYICTTLPLPKKPYKLVGVEPLAKQEVVHHILLFGKYAARLRCPLKSHALASWLLHSASETWDLVLKSNASPPYHTPYHAVSSQMQPADKLRHRTQQHVMHTCMQAAEIRM